MSTTQQADSKRYSGAGSLSGLVQAMHNRIMLLELHRGLSQSYIDALVREAAALRGGADGAEQCNKPTR